MTRVVAIVVSSTTAPTVFRARCRVCDWASHPGGTTEALARAAATAHVEAVHNAHDVHAHGVREA